MSTRFFRAGAGSVIYKDKNTIGFFKRAVPPIGTWELQQGGIDLDEAPEDALWRELAEELGCNKDDFIHITQMPEWTIYQGTDSLEDTGHDRLGQAHKWFFLKVPPDYEINLTKATHQEVSEYKWVSFDEIIAGAPLYKKPVYEKLYTFFKEITREYEQ